MQRPASHFHLSKIILRAFFDIKYIQTSFQNSSNSGFEPTFATLVLVLQKTSQQGHRGRHVHQPERLITVLFVIIFDTTSYGRNYHHYGLQGHLLIPMSGRPYEHPSLTHSLFNQTVPSFGCTGGDREVCVSVCTRQAFNFQPFDFHNRHSHDRKVQFMLPIRRKECMLLGVYNETCGGRTFSERGFSGWGPKLFISSILDKWESRYQSDSLAQLVQI